MGSLRNGLIVALILGASLAIGASFALELVFGAAGAVGFFTIFPLFEEFFKGLCMVIVFYFIWKTIPTRRHGALLGASAGLGFAIVENIIFNIGTAGTPNADGGQIAEAILARWIGLPFMHVLWSAFIGVGFFVLMAQRKVRSQRWLAWPFLLLGWIAHICWNGLSIGISAAAPGMDIILLIFIDIFVVFGSFAFIFRDFLGGHFNFWDFLTPVSEPLPESMSIATPQPEPEAPPPPPPQM
jgi:protease PrsW